MEKMDGLTATELIRQYFPQAKVMIVTQDDTTEMRNAAQQAGATSFAAKENLLNTLDNFKQVRNCMTVRSEGA